MYDIFGSDFFMQFFIFEKSLKILTQYVKSDVDSILSNS